MYKDKLDKTVLEIDPRISAICQPEDGLKISETQLREVLGAYQLSDAMMSLSIISNNLHNDKYPDWFSRIGSDAVRHPLGIFITDFAVSYLAGIILSSKSSDHTYKRKLLSGKKDNLLSLFHIYFNQIQQPDRDFGKEGIYSLLLPMHFEQMNSQLNVHHLSARQWHMFTNTAEQSKEKFSDLHKIFLEKTTLSIKEFVDLALVTFAISTNSPRFNLGHLPKTGELWLDHLVQREKLEVFLNLISTERKSFREDFHKRNTGIADEYSKTKFNPLLLKPVIKLENDYIVPSLSAYKLACFRGVYWWFDNYFIQNKDLPSDRFRQFFGTLFEDYVTELLQDIYKEELFPEKVFYGKKGKRTEFFDQIVECDDRFILFESKAIQFTLTTLQTGFKYSVQKELRNKVVKKGIVQMYKRYKDIAKEDELSRFREKKKTVILVCYDLPFGSSDMYKDLIEQEVIELEKDYPNISDFKYHIIDLWDLEAYSTLGSDFDIESLLEQTKNDPSTSFTGEVQKVADENSIKYIGAIRESYNEHIGELVRQANTRAKQNQ